jgi:hypothetical protein
MPGLASRLVKRYQTISRAFNDWNPINANDATTDNTDLNSFNLGALASIPAQLAISSYIKPELVTLGLLKEEATNYTKLSPPKPISSTLP